MIIEITSIPLHLVFCYTIAIHFNLGLNGIAIAQITTSLTRIAMLYILLNINIMHDIKNCLTPFSMDILNDFKSFSMLAFSGLFIICFDEWAVQSLYIISGFIDL